MTAKGNFFISGPTIPGALARLQLQLSFSLQGPRQSDGTIVSENAKEAENGCRATNDRLFLARLAKPQPELAEHFLLFAFCFLRKCCNLSRFRLAFWRFCTSVEHLRCLCCGSHNHTSPVLGQPTQLLERLERPPKKKKEHSSIRREHYKFSESWRSRSTFLPLWAPGPESAFSNIAFFRDRCISHATIAYLLHRL